MPGAGTVRTHQSYTFTDATIQPHQTYFYRLRQQDLNGRSTHSQWVEVNTTISETESMRVFTVYPQPVRDRLNVRYTHITDVAVHVTLFNLLGHIVYEHDYVLPFSQTEFQIPVESLPKGVYLLRCTTNEQQEVVKITIE